MKLLTLKCRYRESEVGAFVFLWRDNTPLWSAERLDGYKACDAKGSLSDFLKGDLDDVAEQHEIAAKDPELGEFLEKMGARVRVATIKDLALYLDEGGTFLAKAEGEEAGDLYWGEWEVECYELPPRLVWLTIEEPEEEAMTA